jgi:hypothetical protein
MPFSACMQMRAPRSRATLHRAEDLPVVDVEDAGVGHEELEGRDPLVAMLAHLLEGAVVHVGHDHVEAVVDRRPCPRPWRARRRGPCGARSPSAGWRSRRWWWCRRGPRRWCPSRSRRTRWCRRRACRGACGRRCRRGGRTCPRRRSDVGLPKAARCEGWVRATMTPPSIQTSAAKVSTAVTTVPFLMSVRLCHGMLTGPSRGGRTRRGGDRGRTATRGGPPRSGRGRGRR